MEALIDEYERTVGQAVDPRMLGLIFPEEMLITQEELREKFETLLKEGKERQNPYPSPANRMGEGDPHDAKPAVEPNPP